METTNTPFENTEPENENPQEEISFEIIDTTDDNVVVDTDVLDADDEAETTIQDAPTTNFDTISAMLEELNTKFDEKIAKDQYKNGLFDKMYAELQSYKDDLYRKMLKPLISDIILFSDNMRNLTARYEETPDESTLLSRYQQLRKEFLKIGSHIEDMIYNHGIEPFVSEPGDEFNPRNQQAKKTSPTDIPGDNKKIITSLAPGYLWDDQLFRRESVHIKVYEEIKYTENK